MGTEDKLRAYLKRATVELAQTRRRLTETEERAYEPIAIVGMACRYPGGADTAEGLWELLREGRSAVREVPATRWDIDDYYHPDPRTPGGVYTRYGTFLDDITGWDAEFFGLSPREALRMDPHQRLLLELAWEGLENAGLSPSRLAGTRTGVMVGFMDTLQYGRLQIERQGVDALGDPYLGQGSVASIAAGRIAYQLDLIGPTITVDTACSSSLIAVHLAAESLRRGESDLAIAAGASLTLHPSLYIQACAGLMMCSDGRCKTFDEDADGYVMGEGGGLVVLERLSSAVANGRRIHAVLRGSAVNQDGRSNGLTAPSRRAQADVIGRALAAARLSPDDIAYVEAHGSGTHLGDAIELSALHDVFGRRSPDRPLRVGAIKTNIGHTQAAAGVAGLIKTVLILKNGQIPPSLHLTTPAAAFPEDGTLRPVTGLEPLPEEEDRPRLAGVSSFGLSGTNAHIILESAPVPDPREEPARAGTHVLPLSAGSAAALREQATRLADWVSAHPGTTLPDLAHTLQAGRAELDHRRALLCDSPDDAVRRLRATADSGDGHRVKGRPRVAFLLPGVGDQYEGLGRELYAREPVYAEAVDACVELVRRRSGTDLRPLFLPERETAPDSADLAALLGRGGGTAEAFGPLDHAEVAHPFLFTAEYALARLFEHWGVTPDMLIGYSLGEYVAACLAGVFTLEDALHVVLERAHLITAVPTGRMIAVAAPGERIAAALAAAGIDVDVAARNGPSMTVLSGPPAEIEAAAARLAGEGIACRTLRSAHAFHSRLLQPAREKLAAVLDTVPRRAPSSTVVSNLTGRALTEEQATSTSYWTEQLVSTVRFADGVRHCLSQDVDVFVELGPGQTLGGLVRQNLAGDSTAAVLGTLPAHWTGGPRRDPYDDLLQTRARLWELGAPVTWEGAHAGGGQVLSLPTYPFQRTRFWPEQTVPTGPAIPAPNAEPADFTFAHSWRQDPARWRQDAERGLQDGAKGSASDSRPQRQARGGPWDTPSTALGLPGPLVVFADPGGVGTALADLAAASGTPVLEVVAGDGAPRREGRRLTIDPAVPAHYADVFTALGDPAYGHGPVHVAHLWSLTSPTGGRLDDAGLRAAVADGFNSLMLALQALGDLPEDRGVRLLTVTRGATEILGDDIPSPHQALSHGLGRAARHEYPGLTWQGTDLDPALASDPGPVSNLGLASAPDAGLDLHSSLGREPESELGAGSALDALRLAQELLHQPDPDAGPDAPDPLAGWRRGRRWVRSWAPVSTAPPPAPVWREDGTYLITGGTRGLGMALAKHLVRAGVRRLALVGRTPLRRGRADGGRAEQAWEGGTADGDRAERTLRDVAELEASGAEVLLLTADTGVPDQLREALRRGREHFGALTGVIHAAGLPAGGLLRRRTVAEAAEVLAPKVLAMGPLAELVGPGTPAAERPELLVLYSSAVTAFGGIGEGDYCAANTVLDAYGDALAATSPSTRVVSVAWGPWQHDVWQSENLKSAGGLADRVAAYRARYGFADDAGCELLDRIVAGGHGSVMAVRQPLHEVVRAWSDMLDLDDLIGAASAVPAGERFPRPQLRTDFAAPRTEAETEMAELWGAYLGIDRVGVHDPFFDLGGNSLLGMAMVLALEKRLGHPVPPALLFEHPTIAEFAAALDGEGGAGGGVQESLTTSSARGQRRRRARSSNRK
ncbi:beta-ketoacyl synthase N-terminal-like domain-containing protein [Nonomuraea sp. ZG12]|uniref:beta-ketoacyl synthase N-terminal-like domain-containing protein n=1 Tax=Nonomuraea sp. ZG12 TaxID=3452207 RepID=UPI003F89F25D